MQFTQVYVQKSTKTTLPRSSSMVNGPLLIQALIPVISGAGKLVQAVEIKIVASAVNASFAGDTNTLFTTVP